MSDLDTLKEYQRLIATGIPEKEAYAHIETSVNILKVRMQDVATKQDLKDLQIATKQDMKDLQIATQQDMKDFKSEIRSDFAVLAKDFFYIKLMIGGMFALGALQMIQHALKVAP